ncbi:MAG TPA: DMT family transporter [Xanthomonadales bacterium]|nr:DMT family transporter [Xanthomonadales bacterium]
MISPADLFDQPSKGYAVLMIIFGFASFALANILAERTTGGLAPAAVAGVTMLSAAAVLWIVVFLFESVTNLSPGREGWLQLAGLGIVGSALPGFLLYALIKRAGAEFTSLYGYVMPLFGLMVGWLAFGRPPQHTWLLGIPVTFVGVAIVQRNLRGRRKAPE